MDLIKQVYIKRSITIETHTHFQRSFSFIYMNDQYIQKKACQSIIMRFLIKTCGSISKKKLFISSSVER